MVEGLLVCCVVDFGVFFDFDWDGFEVVFDGLDVGCDFV